MERGWQMGLDGLKGLHPIAAIEEPGGAVA
jgi:hypothetical protein